MLELLPFDDESTCLIDEVVEQIDAAVDASFLGDMAEVLERVKRAREQVAAAIA